MKTVKVIGLYEGKNGLYIGDVLDGPWYEIAAEETLAFANLAAAFMDDVLPSYMVKVPDPYTAEGAEVVAEMSFIVNQAGQPIAKPAARKMLSLAGRPPHRFQYQHCVELGITDDYYNVLSHGRVIGYIRAEFKEGFERGDNKHFVPIREWKTTFSPKLIAELGLKVKK